MKIIFIIILIFSAAALFFIFLRRRTVAESGTHREVGARLARLKQDPARDAFWGFCTRNEDALYFVCANGMFFLDYELSDPGKKLFEAPFRESAREFGVKVIDTTYHGEFPVLRVKAGEKEEEAAKLGFRFAQKIFGHTENTIIEFLSHD